MSSLGVPSDVGVGLHPVPVGQRSVVLLGLPEAQLLSEGLDRTLESDNGLPSSINNN